MLTMNLNFEYSWASMQMSQGSLPIIRLTDLYLKLQTTSSYQLRKFKQFQTMRDSNSNDTVVPDKVFPFLSIVCTLSRTLNAEVDEDMDIPP